jgi:hypothetical protein
MGDMTAGLEHERKVLPIGEVAGAAAVLSLAGLLLVLLMGTLDAGKGGVADSSSGHEHVPDFRIASPSAERAANIMVVGAGQADEVSARLAREGELRGLLGELRRDASVVVAADLDAAELIQRAVQEQAAITGLPALRAVVVAGP